MARKTSSRRPVKKAAVKRTAVAKRKRKLARRNPARRRPANKKTFARRKPRLTTATGGERAIPRKFADTDQQIEALRHHVSEQSVSIAPASTLFRPR